MEILMSHGDSPLAPDATVELADGGGIIAGVGPTSRAMAFLAVWLPWLLTPLARRRFRGHDHASRSLARFARGWVEPDRATLDKPSVRATIIASLTEAFRQGYQGAALDGTLLAGRL
jgi:hypothetical protein